MNHKSKINNSRCGGKIILGLIGELAAGKGTVASYLKKKYGAVSFRFSDSLRETLNDYDLEVSRENMQKLSTILRQNFAENILAKAITQKIKNTQEKIITIDGVRRLTDIENLKDLTGFYLIYITADQKTRYNRYIKRNENTGDDLISFKNFQEKEKAEADRQIPEVAQAAKFIINNNGTVEELHQQIDEILKKLN